MHRTAARSSRTPPSPRPQESWSDPKAFNSTFDVFSYSARPLHLNEGDTVTLVPADGAHLPPQTDAAPESAPSRNKRAQALQAHAARTSHRLSKRTDEG